jgi:superfamily II DNA or RNA helicase
MDIYNNLKKIAEEIKDYILKANNVNIIELKKDLIQMYLKNINLPQEIINLILEDEKLFIKIIDRYKNITECYIKNSDTLENLLKNIQKSLLKENNNLLKLTLYNFDKIIYEYLDKSNFFQLCYDEKNADNIIITKQDIEDYKIKNPDELLQNKEFTWRENQKEAIDRIKNYGFETGIHCQATGTGKSLIILKYIDLMYKKNPQCRIILFTERVSILADLLDFKNKKKYDFWKKHNICDLKKICIEDRVTKKIDNWVNIINESEGPILLVINRAYLTLTNKYKKIKNLSLILHDECHNVPSNKCYNFLKYNKKMKIPIVGFSATPLRSGITKKNGVNISNMSRLLEIYGTNNKLNLLTNYNMIYAISNNPPLILSPQFYWYDIEYLQTKKKYEEQQLTLIEIGSAMRVLDDVVKSLQYKKVVAWCGTIPLCKEWYNEMNKNKNRYSNLKDMELYMDLSIKNDSSIKTYDEFKNLETNGIMFCAQKHREGSDIYNLDACIFLDKVKNRGNVPFIQSIGRVLRLDPKNKKKCGIIIDGVIRDDDNYEKIMADKILGYYFALSDIANIEDMDCDTDKSSKYKEYMKLRDVVEFDKDNKIINLNFNKTKITINCKELKWKNIIERFETILENKFNLTDEEKLKIEFEKLKNLIKNKNFKNMTEYEKYAKKHKLITNPKDKFNKFWINYCDFLNIDTTKYIKKKTLRMNCKNHNIKTINDYLDKLHCGNEDKIPEDPCDYYKVNSFEHFIENNEDLYI